MEELKGKAALVTGAAKRIGRALALTLAKHGADVAITYRHSKAEAQTTVEAISKFGVRASAVQCDVADPQSVRAGVDAAIEKLGGLDLLVNNAGTFDTLPLESISAAQWDMMLNTNTRGPFLVAQAAHAELKQREGRIVNIGSLGGLHPWATHAHYCVSKAALHMLTQTMAKAWAPQISVNCVAPGMIVNGDVDPGYEHFIEKTPMGRNGTPADVAAAMLFFVTGPRFITGQVLSVDGGLGL